ncbi:MAG TPA: SLC13 family permease [Ureibacillus sp.]|nr:SLC13 family permease [Ureibacillus sp.]
MSIEVISIIILAGMFTIGTFFSINIGVLGFIASFIIFLFSSDLELTNIYSSFPAELFILLAGVTYFFAIIESNGTVDLITRWGLGLLRGKVGLIPWVLFFIALILTSIGTSVIPVCAVLAPIGLRLAFQYNINPIMMVVVMQSGIVAGSFSPLNIFGIIVNGSVSAENIAISPVMLYVAILLFNAFIALGVYTAFGGIKLIRNSNSLVMMSEVAVKYDTAENNGLNWYRGLTLACLVLLVVLVLGFKQNMGFVALTLGALLAFGDHKNQSEVLKKMPWSTILLVSGIVTYIGVLSQVGTIEYVTGLIEKVNNPYITSLVSGYIGAIISAFASTTGILGVIFPMVVPILTDPSISTIGVVIMISLSASLVDIAPFTTGGSLYLANVQGVPQRKFFMQLLAVGGLFVVLSPIVAWLIFVVLGSLIF